VSAPLEAGAAYSDRKEYPMVDTETFAAELRDRAGKGAARAARRAGRVPAVIYGAKKDPVMITVAPRELDRLLNRAGFYGTLFDIDVDGTKHQVLARDVQFHPVSDQPLHVDFLRVTERTRINVDVQVDFIDEEESVGLTRGGVLNIVRRDVELSCLAGNIPSSIVISLAGLDIGDSVHISGIDLPEGVTPTISDRDFTIATIAAPTIVVEEEEEGEEGEEGDSSAEKSDGD
jgi:large subunit ribosomal protein L25